MKIKGLTKEQIELSLLNVNKEYNGNIIFNRFDQDYKSKLGKLGKSYIVTLKVKNSKGPGSRFGFTGRRINAACWHVHGNFFEELIKINTNVIITVKGKKLDNNNVWDNDYNIGTQFQPLYYSESCDCGSLI